MSVLILNHFKYKNFSVLMLLGALTYFIYHLFNGNHGLISLLEIKNQIRQSNFELDEVVSRKLIISHKTSLLKEQSLDIDMLDEQVRRILGYSHENERVIIRK